MNQLLKIVSILLVFILGTSNMGAQNNALHLKTWVKKNEVLLRWAPFNKADFYLGMKNGYKIIRTDAAGNTVEIASKIMPYAKEDSLWTLLLKKGDNAIIAVSALYDNKGTNKNPQKKSEEEVMIYNMMLLSCDFDAELAQACGLFFRDKSVDNSKTYTYKISVNAPIQKPIVGTLLVDANRLSTHPEINDLKGIFKNKSVKLKWNAAIRTPYYAAYNLERSRDSVNFEVINKAPIILLSSQFEKKKEFIYYLDTFPTTKQKYYYRLKGLNHFGEWSGPSNMVSGIGYDELKSHPVFDTIHTIQNKSVYMKWRMADKSETKNTKAYLIVRSKKDKGPYEIIHTSTNNLDYTDESPQAVNFYKVAAVSYGGDTLYSYSYMALINDTIPPSIPLGLKAKVDTKGNVTLTWNKNPEEDVQGYKIYRTNALHEEFVQINQEFAKETIYHDKLNLKTLSKKIYYAVNATDKLFNNSDLSEPVEVKRPDTIAPVAPIITSLKMDLKGIHINWILSTSEDVKYYVLYRTNEANYKEEKLREWTNTDSLKTFFDSTLMAGNTYRYKILVSDEDDNISLSNSPFMKFETGFRKKLESITSKVDREKKNIQLNWNYNETNIEKYIIYRCKKGGQLTIIKTLAGIENHFIDDDLYIGNFYYYCIKPVFTDGTEGIISNRVEVEY